MQINTGNYPSYTAPQSPTKPLNNAPSFQDQLAAEEKKRAPIAPLSNPLTTPKVSAPAEEGPSLISDPEAIKALLREWKSKFDQRDKSEALEARIENNISAFEELIDRAAAEGGYHDPETFVRSLSEKELAVLQAMHNLAQPIVPGKLSQESCFNLLLPPNAVQDINKDGTISVGAARIFSFPPAHAPQQVKKAWEATVEGLELKEIALLQSRFKYAKGMGGPAYIPADASYIELTQSAIFNAEQAMLLDMSSPEAEKNRRRTIELLKKFLDHLNNPA